MTPNIVWISLVILFGIAEAVTVGLTSLWFAVGALGALLCAMLGGAVWLQIVVFLVISGLMLVLVRPLTRKYLVPHYAPTNADRVIGAAAIVSETIDNLQGRGQVKVAGQVWTARSDTGEVIEQGASVRVLRIEGVKVFVVPGTGENN